MIYIEQNYNDFMKLMFNQLMLKVSVKDSQFHVDRKLDEYISYHKIVVLFMILIKTHLKTNINVLETKVKLNENLNRNTP
jgi:hypothetical protein